MKNNITKMIVNSIIKWILILNVCKTIFCNADPAFEDIYSKMCSVLKVTRFCLPYMMGSYPYPYYALPAPVSVPVAPFPLIVNPTTSGPPFTIPTIYTTIRPFGPSGGGLPPTGPVCPPSPSICPPAALSLPFIDQRQGM